MTFDIHFFRILAASAWLFFAGAGALSAQGVVGQEIEVQVKCTVSRSDPMPTICTLAVSGASTALRGTDYRVDPPITGRTITIPGAPIKDEPVMHSIPLRFTPIWHEDRNAKKIIITGTARTGDKELKFDVPMATITLWRTGLDISPSPLPKPFETFESGASRSFTMKLLSPPREGAVVVDAVSDDTSEARVSPASLTFTASDWDRPQPVTVTGVDDRVDDGDQEYQIRFAVNHEKTDESNSQYGNMEYLINGFNIDDDEAVIEWNIHPEFLTEDGGQQEVRITASLVDGITLPEELEITFTRSGSARSPMDYMEFTPPPVTIRSRIHSIGSDPFFITVMKDSERDSGETIVLTPNDPNYSMGSLTLYIREFDLYVNQSDSNNIIDGVTHIVEDRGMAWFDVRLPTPPDNGNVVVKVESDDISEAAVSRPALTFTPDNWDMPQNVHIVGKNDDFDDGDRRYNLIFKVDNDNTMDGNYHDKRESFNIVSIDDDDAMISLRADPASLIEDVGEQSVVITAALGGSVRLESDAVITLRKGGGSADEGDDYAAFTLPQSITIPANTASAGATFKITPTADNAPDSGETIFIAAELSGHDIASLALPINEFDLYVSDLLGATGENGATAMFTLRLPTMPASEPVVVDVRSSDVGEASVMPPSLTFTASNWNDPQTVTVTGKDDHFDDGDVDYMVNLSVNGDKTADARYHGRMASVSATNEDNDTAMITLSAAPAFLKETGVPESVTITASLAGEVRLEQEAAVMLVKAGGTATEGSDYEAFTLPATTLTIPANAASASTTVSITVKDDGRGDSNETIVITAETLPPHAYDIEDLAMPIREFRLDVGPLTGTVTEDGGSASFTVRVPSPPDSGIVVVNVSSSDESEAQASPASLTFTTSNWDMPQRVMVTSPDDIFDDGDTTYTLTVDVDEDNTDDANYHPFTEFVSGISMDNDAAMITLSAVPPFLKEAGGSQGVTITASLAGEVRLEEDAVIDLGRESGTATLNADYAAFTLPASITIPARMASASATLTITTTADEEPDKDETIVFTATFAPYDIENLALPIREFGLEWMPLMVSTSEDGNDALFRVKLITAPASGEVVVDVSSSDVSEATVSPTTLTFTTGNWNKQKTVTVTGVNDDFDDDEQLYKIHLAVNDGMTDDANYHDIAETVLGANTDNDTAMITLSASPAFLNEGDGAQGVVITASLVGGILLEREAVVGLSKEDGTADEGVDYEAFTLPATTFTIPAEEASATVTFTITTTSDETKDSGETIVFGGTLSSYKIDDLALPIYEFDLNVSDLQGMPSEDGETAYFSVGLPTIPASGVVVVNVRSSDMSEALVWPSTLRFTRRNWDTVRSVAVIGVDDIFDDDDARYSIDLEVDKIKTDDGNYHRSAASIMDVATTDNDEAMIALVAAPAFLTEGATQDVVITASLAGAARLENEAEVHLERMGGTADEADDYNAFDPPGPIIIPARMASASTTFTVTTDEDEKRDSGETIVFGGTSPPYTIEAIALPIYEFGLNVSETSVKTSEERAKAYFSVGLPTAPASGAVVVDVRSSDLGEALVWPKTLRFTGRNWHTVRNVVVIGVDDNFDDDDMPYTVDLTVDDDNTDDAHYHGKKGSVSGMNSDNDDTQIILSASPAFLTEDHGAQDVIITTRLSNNVRVEEYAVVTLRRAGGTANVPADYTAFMPPAVTISANTDSAGVTVPITTVLDSVDDSGETIVIAAESPPYDIADLVLPINEFDLKVSEWSGRTTEAGGTATFTLALPTAPLNGEVVVSVSSSDEAEAVVSPAMLTFTTSNWSMPQTVTVTGVNDNFDDGDKYYMITLAVNESTEDVNYHGRRSALESANTDDDETDITLSASPTFLTEGGGAQRVVITADLGSGGKGVRLQKNAVVALGEGSGSAEEGTDYDMFTLPPNITIFRGAGSAGTTFEITTIADNDERRRETIVITAELSGYEIKDLELEILRWELDVDAHKGIIAPDGIMVARYLLGVRGASLIAGQSGEDADIVADNIKIGVETKELDVDADEDVDVVDGILIARYLLGLRGDALVDGLEGADADTVKENIEKFLP